MHGSSFLILFLETLLSLRQISSETASLSKPSFCIDYKRNAFLLDGKPFRYVSGSVHYARVHPSLWRDRLRRIRSADFNAVQFYVEWNLHEKSPGKYDFTGRFDLETFIKTAQEEGLFVLLRLGPYICGERSGGGLPYWIYAKDPKVKMRTRDPKFMGAVARWWAVLLPKVERLLRGNGGPVLMAQVENEYGNFGCDKAYLETLRDLAWKHLGNDTVLYATDNPGGVNCSKIPGVYSTIDFGPGTDPSSAFSAQRSVEPRGPLVNSEFYPAWFDTWGRPHQTSQANATARALEAVLERGASVNVYMMHGGTNFGFEAGAGARGEADYASVTTSYDYDAPVAEAGDLTDKFVAFKAAAAKFVPASNVTVDPKVPKYAYGSIEMKAVASAFDVLGVLSGDPVTSAYPLTFGQLGRDSGFVLYETAVTDLAPDPAWLDAGRVHDRAQVFVDEDFAGIVTRSGGKERIPVTAYPGQKISLLVENFGRVDDGSNDPKGLVSNLTFNSKTLTNWTMHPFPLDDGEAVSKMALFKLRQKGRSLEARPKHPTFWAGVFWVSCSSSNWTPLDSFLKLDGWTKGSAFVNGFNLGRYWAVGPQRTLYVPGQVMECGENIAVLFDTGGASSACLREGGWKCFVEFVDAPTLDGPTPTKKARERRRFVKNRKRKDLIDFLTFL